MFKFVLFLVALISVKAQAYPEFIGYGYASCVTCHYNGNGGGPLTDYGRALWSTEIASRAFFSKSTTVDQLGEQSGFLGSAKLPFWLRPHLDYRGLELYTNPGSKTQSSKKFYEMQTDIGVAVQNRSGKIAGVITFGRVLPPAEYAEGRGGINHMMANDYFVRAEVAEGWWVYAGLMEKVFGLRNVDHTSYQRMFQTFNMQNDSLDGTAESEGLIVQKVAEKWEISANAFFGNPYDSQPYKQSGGSMMGEFDVGENKRLGASLLSAHNQKQNKQMAAVHYRQKLSTGSALLFEYGLIKNLPQGNDTTVGSYNFIEATAQMTRGYSLLTTIERYNAEFKASAADLWRFGFGVQMFPLPRFEFRVQAVNMRNFSGVAAQPEEWLFEGQVHVSL
jgi:hypothetical protein